MSTSSSRAAGTIWNAPATLVPNSEATLSAADPDWSVGVKRPSRNSMGTIGETTSFPATSGFSEISASSEGRFGMASMDISEPRAAAPFSSPKTLVPESTEVFDAASAARDASRDPMVTW